MQFSQKKSESPQNNFSNWDLDIDFSQAIFGLHSVKSGFFVILPLSCLRLLLLLQILTVQTDKTMATIKNKMPPMRPAVTARLFTLSGKSYLNVSLTE